MTPENSLRLKLIKLLNLTTSDNEALVSIRMANQIISKNGITWSYLLEDDRPIQYLPPTYEDHEESINEMLDYIDEHKWGDFDDTFVKSIGDSWEQSQRLTWRQLQGLRRVYEAVKKHHERRG